VTRPGEPGWSNQRGHRHMTDQDRLREAVADKMREQDASAGRGQPHTHTAVARNVGESQRVDREDEPVYPARSWYCSTCGEPMRRPTG
jgi:hypothetical protein